MHPVSSCHFVHLCTNLRNLIFNNPCTIFTTIFEYFHIVCTPVYCYRFSTSRFLFLFGCSLVTYSSYPLLFMLSWSIVFQVSMIIYTLTTGCLSYQNTGSLWIWWTAAHAHHNRLNAIYLFSPISIDKIFSFYKD